jgi:uncharacterized protein (TIGR02246 family)
MVAIDRMKALKPEDIARLFVERVNAGDAEGMAELYEPDAILAFPPGKQTVGRDAIRHLFEEMVKSKPHFEEEEPLSTLRFEDLALTSTRPSDKAGARAQVARRQRDGSWLRILDRPEMNE